MWRACVCSFAVWPGYSHGGGCAAGGGTCEAAAGKLWLLPGIDAVFYFRAHFAALFAATINYG